MAIKLSEEYTYHTAPSADYPYGSFKNTSTAGGTDGTPLEKAWADDIAGFLQALLTEAGVVASGIPDTALVSQYFEALTVLFAAATHDHTEHALDAETFHKTDIVLPQSELRGRTDITSTIDQTGVAWLNTDLSTVVPNGARFAILFFEIQAAVPNNNTQVALLCRPNGTSGAGIAVASFNAGGEGGALGNGGQVIVPITSSRQLQLKLSAPLTVLGLWYRVQGYLL